MNAIRPAAHARAVTGFTDSKAGTGSIVSSDSNRSPLHLLVRFLLLSILTFFLSAPQVQAAATKPCVDGAAITVDGTINKFVRERRVSTTLRHSDTIFNEYFRLSLWVC